MKRRTIIALALTIAMGITSTAAFAQISFSDIKTTNWAHPYISFLVDKGGIAGYPDGTFKPNNTMTNAEFLKTIIGATLGEQEKTSAHWASGYFEKALEKGILLEGELNDVWNEPMTRQQMAVIMDRTAGKVLNENAITEKETLDKIQGKIADYDTICDACKESVVQAYGKGLIAGMPGGLFAPIKTATRAEAATMITRLLDKSYRVDPLKNTGNITEMISNPEYDEVFLGDAKTYEIADKNYFQNLKITQFNGAGTYKYIEWKLDKKINGVYFIKDGKIVDRVQKNSFPTDEKQEGGYDSDITTVDYIGSLNYSTGILTLVPNPWKGAVYKDVVIMEYPK